MDDVHPSRVTALNSALPNEQGSFVLYWMTAFRRTGWNFSLDRAVDWARRLKRPLVVLEALRIRYPWASRRLHRFIIEGMADNARALAKRPVTYYPYVEPKAGAESGLVQALAAQSCLVVADDFPSFFLPAMLKKVAARLPVRMEKVDANGLLPLAAAPQTFQRAYDFRRYLQRTLPEYLDQMPRVDSLKGARLPRLAKLPAEITARWPAASERLLALEPGELEKIPVDDRVQAAAFRGGPQEAEGVLARFVEQRLSRYGDERNQPESQVSSGFSPYLHFGHLSVHQVFHAVMQHTGWTREHLSNRASGQREGWWGAPPAVEAFLDELITWRELGYNFSHHRPDHDQYDSLPQWAQTTLAKHALDPRPHVYQKEELERAQTHDRLWNAAQTQLVREGRMHNYLRMLWGKKILEWSPTPRHALEALIELNNLYAVDGRNPNSYTGIFWVLGRFDRPWAPERPIFGTIRYMSSENTARKLNVRAYLERYCPAAQPTLF